MTTDATIIERIRHEVENNTIVIFMKGTADFPQCGFSAVVIKIFKNLKLPFKAIDVLSDPSIRQGVKDFSNWPTIPQVYVCGEFIGGSDIVREMYQAGELQALLHEKGLLSSAELAQTA